MSSISMNRERGTLEEHAQAEYAPHANGVAWNEASVETKRRWLAYVKAVRECWQLEDQQRSGLCLR